MVFSYEDASHYGSNGGGNYFSLKGDGDTARVRLLGHDMEDFPGYACHEIKVGGSRKYVNCLRESYKSPKSDCPMCQSGDAIKAKMFIPLYNIDEDEVQVWERGKMFMKKMSGYCARHKDVVQWVTEIERNGKPRDTSTTYELYDDGEGPDKDVSLDDFDIPEIMGRYILDKSFEDLEYFLDNDEFPSSDSDDSADDGRIDRRKRRSRGGRRRRDEEEEY